MRQGIWRWVALAVIVALVVVMPNDYGVPPIL